MPHTHPSRRRAADSLALAWDALPDAEPTPTSGRKTAHAAPDGDSALSQSSPKTAAYLAPVGPPAPRPRPPVEQPAVTSTAQWSTARPATPPRPRLRDTGELLETVLPYLKWAGLGLGGLAVGFAIAGFFASSRPELVTHPVQIKVLLKDKLLPGAHVTLTPITAPSRVTSIEDHSQVVGRGVVALDGTASPAATGHSGLPDGEYVASVTWCKVKVEDGETIAGPDLVPQVFRSPSTSPLRVTVTPDHNSLVTLALRLSKVAVRRASDDHE